MIYDFGQLKSSLSVGGINMEAISCDFEFTLNAPPSFSCLCIPHSHVNKGVADDAEATLFWDTMAGIDENVGQPSVSLSLSWGDNDFNFNGTGWVLTGISASASATAESPAAMTIYASHPIVQLSKYPTNVGSVAKTPHQNTFNATNYLEIIKEALAEYSRSVTDNDKKQRAYSLLQEGLGEVDKYLDCSACDASKMLDNIYGTIGGAPELRIKAFRKYIMSCVEHSGANSNLMSFITNAFASDLSLGLYMDPYDLSATKMIVKPAVPYTPDIVKIDANSIVRIQSGSDNWLAPAGVYTSTVMVPPDAHTDGKYSLIELVRPSYVSVISKSSGLQTVAVSLPPWFGAVLATISHSVGKDPSDDLQTIPDLRKTKQVEAVRKILTQNFLDIYRQSSNISIERQFSATEEGTSNLILPGMTCQVSSGLRSGHGLMFLISKVVHSINLMSKHASTAIFGNYVRATDLSVEAEGAEDEQLITDGCSAEKNYLWG